MKIRNGFVSNSSSSSFIVVFDRPTLDVEYLKETLYNNAPSIFYMYGFDHDTWWYTEELCEKIKNTMKKITTREELIEELSNISSYDDFRIPQFPKWNKNKELYNKECNKYEAKLREVVNIIADEILAAGKNKHIFVGEFSDNDGSIYAQLEHDDTFGNVFHKKINNH